MISPSEAREMEREATAVKVTTETRLLRAEELLNQVNDILMEVADDHEYLVFADTYDDEGTPQFSLTKYRRIQ
jgi:hypothetical protein